MGRVNQSLQEPLRLLAQDCVLRGSESRMLRDELIRISGAGLAGEFVNLVSQNRMVNPLADILANGNLVLGSFESSLEAAMTANRLQLVMRDKLLRKLTQTLDAAGIDHVFFKTINRTGTAGVDVDLLIDVQEFSRCIDTLCKNGFYPIDSLSKKYATGFMIKNNPVIVDLHTKLAVLGVEYFPSRVLLDNKRQVTLNCADGLGPIEAKCLENEIEAEVRVAHAVIKEGRITIGDIYEVFSHYSGHEEAISNGIRDERLQLAWSVFAEVASFALGTQVLGLFFEKSSKVRRRIALSMLRGSFAGFIFPLDIPRGTSVLSLLDTLSNGNELPRSISKLVTSLRYERNAAMLGKKVILRLGK